MEMEKSYFKEEQYFSNFWLYIFVTIAIYMLHSTDQR